MARTAHQDERGKKDERSQQGQAWKTKARCAMTDYGGQQQAADKDNRGHGGTRLHGQVARERTGRWGPEEWWKL